MNRETKIGVPVLIQSEAGMSSLTTLLDTISDDFKKGFGRYTADGAYKPQEPIFGLPAEPACPAHQYVRAALKTTIVFAQGFSRTVEGLHEQSLVARHDGADLLYDEVHIKRSQQLINKYYLSNGMPVGESLAEFTRWGMSDSHRNRKRMRDVVAVPFEYYGLWQVNRDEKGQASFTAGPTLVLFCEHVLNKMSD